MRCDKPATWRDLMLEVVGFGLAAVVLSYLGVVVLIRWAERRQILDIPNERSSHTRPTPRGGGLAIVLVVLVGWLVALSLSRDSWESTDLIYVIGAAFIAVVSWLDDLRSLSNRVRFGTHMLAALLVIGAFGYWTNMTVPIVGSLRLGLLGLPITFLWIVGLTNAYNFMDGIDGIAGGQAVVAGLGWAILGWLTAQPLVGVLGVLLAAASLGFLGHNWPPARIFMGDVGSAFLGYSFAVLAVIASKSDTRLAVAGFLLVWPFVFDTTFTLLRRLRMKENIFAAHRSHLYQRLVILGYSHGRVTLLYAGLAALGGVLAVAWVLGAAAAPYLIAILIPTAALSLLYYVQAQERAGHPVLSKRQ
jgi:UDP-N-acetylmuramyl pentapeptide phosphotransferase/UDP-N-acetylglucosamine-1-phosphate transferase